MFYPFSLSIWSSWWRGYSLLHLTVTPITVICAKSLCGCPPIFVRLDLQMNWKNRFTKKPELWQLQSSLQTLAYIPGLFMNFKVCSTCVTISCCSRKKNSLLTQTFSKTSIMAIFPKVVDPVMKWHTRVVASRLAHWSPNRATDLLHASRVCSIQSRWLDSPMRWYRATEERWIVASTSVYRTELLLLLLLTLLGHSWVLRLVLRLADAIWKPRDRILWRKGSCTAGMWRKSRVGWCQVVVERSRSNWGVFSMEQCIGKSNNTLWLWVYTSALTCI